MENHFFFQFRSFQIQVLKTVFTNLNKPEVYKLCLDKLKISPADL